MDKSRPRACRERERKNILQQLRVTKGNAKGECNILCRIGPQLREKNIIKRGFDRSIGST
jgi:hypothetical protein